MRLIECVPNFSEGRRPEIIGAIVAPLRSCSGVHLLHVDTGATANRTVVTLVGSPDAMIEALLEACRVAAACIDMRQHHGVHPRIGAVDVCPFVPLRGLTLADCAHFARRFAARLGEELALPVYLYGAAAKRSDRTSLVHVRRGEYENLALRLVTPQGAPDCGPPRFNERLGATAVGARPLLIAYNVNLDTTDVAIAREIAAELRSSGKALRNSAGQVLRGDDGRPRRRPGTLAHCMARGWLIPEFNCAQVTMNLTNYGVTNLHRAYDAVVAAAGRRNVAVRGSEVVGLVPKAALLDSGRAYHPQATGDDDALMGTAIARLKLDDCYRFDLQQKVLEYRLEAVSGIRLQ